MTAAAGGRPEQSLVGRADVLRRLAELRSAAGNGELSVLVLDGDAGIGKTAVAEAARREAAADGWQTAWVQGVEVESALSYAGLLALVRPLRTDLAALPEPQQSVLAAALGWSGKAVSGDRFQVAAATLALLGQAAERTPLLIVVDDLGWLDAESAEALVFAVRRLRYDRVAVVLTRRTGQPDPVDLTGLEVQRLSGLPPDAVRGLLGPGYSASVLGALVRETEGNPLAVLESARSLTSVQRVGAQELPAALPVPERLSRIFTAELKRLSPGATLAVRLAAASQDLAAGPVVAALHTAGLAPASCLDEAAPVLAATAGQLVFRHPLVRSVAWRATSTAERREAHAALADALPDGPARTWHRAEAATGPDPTLAADLAASAEQARARRGYAGASAAYEQAARLAGDRVIALDYLAAAVDDAFLAGDGARARRLAEQVLAEATGPGPRATVLFVLGLLEQHTGTFPRAKALLTEAADIAAGSLRIRALSEVASLCYLFDDRSGVAVAAEQARRDADPGVPEQAMLAAYLSGAAAVFEGRLAEGAEWTVRALDLLEGEPSLRDDPRYLTVALMCGRWLLDPNYQVNGLTLLQIGTRRIAAARQRGALGPLASGLSLAAGGLAWTGEHLQAYAFAGEAVELLDTLGYTVEPGVSHETLAMECAARGRFAESDELLARAEDVMRRTGFGTLQPHLAHAMIICALSRVDLTRVVTLGEDLLRRHGGAGWMLEPLGVAPPLVEAYLALGREDEAADLAERFAAASGSPPHPYVAAGVARCRALVSADLTEARGHFEQAIAHQRELGDPFELGRTRLLYGMRLRRAGERVAAREQLRAALTDFAVSDHTVWEERVLDELAASGERARRRSQPADAALSSQETRVALLVAQGLTNREVASTLFLSPKTVEHHLSSVLRKRGLRTRTALAHDLAVTEPG